MKILLGCDIGTTSVKVIAMTPDGHLLYTCQQDYSMLHPYPDWHEQQPEEIVTATFTSIQRVLQAITPHIPTAIIFSAAMHSLMVVDKNNQPVTPLMIWADNRSIVEAEALKKGPLGDYIYHQTGTPIHPMSPLCKLQWLRVHQPSLLQISHKFVGIKEYVLFHLTQQWITDYSIASATGLFNIHSKSWEPTCLDALGVTPEQLPLPVSPTAQYQVSASVSWLDPSIKIIPGASDGCLANLGAGALSKGKMALTIGTSSAVRVASGTAYTASDKSTFCYLLDDTTYICGGGSNSGGKVYEWAATTFFPDHSSEEIATFISQTPSTHLLFFPYLFGERAPLWNATIKGGFAGLTITHTRAHMMRAVQEGILFNLLLICEQIERQQNVEVIYANGGFVTNTYWVQMLADIFNKPIVINESKEAAAIGAIILGFKSIGLLQQYEDAAHFHTEQARFIPNPVAHQEYQNIYTVFKQQLNALIN